jgi:hypothetical protein
MAARLPSGRIRQACDRRIMADGLNTMIGAWMAAIIDRSGGVTEALFG